MPATTPARTAFDLGRRDDETTAVIRLDALANATSLDGEDVHAASRRTIAGHADRPTANGRRADGWRVRSRRRKRGRGCFWCVAGLPSAADPDRCLRRLRRAVRAYRHGVGGVVGRCRIRRAATLDGSLPSHSRHRQVRRLEQRGWRIMRVNNDILRYRPGVFLARVCAALQAAGADVASYCTCFAGSRCITGHSTARASRAIRTCRTARCAERHDVRDAVGVRRRARASGTARAHRSRG